MLSTERSGAVRTTPVVGPCEACMGALDATPPLAGAERSFSDLSFPKRLLSVNWSLTQSANLSHPFQSLKVAHLSWAALPSQKRRQALVCSWSLGSLSGLKPFGSTRLVGL